MKKLQITICLLYCCLNFLIAQPAYIAECMPSNRTFVLDLDYWQLTDWIEIYRGDSIKTLYISDELHSDTYTELPSSFQNDQQSIILIADGKDTLGKSIHCHFKLNKNGETIYLFNSAKELIDSLKFKSIPSHISATKTAPWSKVLYSDTPNYNTPSTHEKGIELTPKVRLEYPSGWYTSIIPQNDKYEKSIEINNYTHNRFTFPISSTQIVSITQTEINLLKSEPTFYSYFFSRIPDIPCISVITDNELFYSDTYGIYNDKDIKSRKEWKRPVHIQHFEQGRLLFENDAEVRLFGSTAYELPQKSLAVFISDSSTSNYTNNTTGTEESFLLRSSSDDWHMTMLKDGFIQTLIAKNTTLETQSYNPIALHINGIYYGIHNVREKINEDLFKNTYGIKKNDLNLLSFSFWDNSVEVKHGTDIHYQNLLRKLEDEENNDSSQLATIHQLLDLENFLSYTSSQIYIGNRSWKHNMMAWNSNKSLPLRWLLYDLDRGYSDSEHPTYTEFYDRFKLYRLVSENSILNSYIIQNLLLHSQITFAPEEVAFVLDSLSENIKNEMPYHIDRWRDVGGVSSMDEWKSNLIDIKSFSTTRFSHIQNQIAEKNANIEYKQILIGSTIPHAGTIKLS